MLLGYGPAIKYNHGHATSTCWRGSVSYLSPHMARALRAASLETTVIELLDPTPYPSGTSEVDVAVGLSGPPCQRSYDRAITDFVDWYCSEPRLAFNRTVVLRYRIYLEQRQYAATTINLRLAAVRRVAYEAADSGLLSPELAAGIRRVKGVRRIGVRIGNWLTAEQSKRLLAGADRESLRGRGIMPCSRC